MTKQTGTMLAVTLSCPQTNESFEANVPLFQWVEEAHEFEVISDIVKAAAEQFKQHLATARGRADADTEAFIW